MTPDEDRPAEDAMGSFPKIVVAIVAGAAIAVGAFLLGRLTAAPAHRSSTSQPGDYFDGLRVGEAQGLQNGRALQEGNALPRGARNVARRAFNAGYVAGTNDVFAGYDGGWTLHMPWIITIEDGSGQIVYRIRDRTAIEPGVNYYLCPDGHSVCQQRRP